MNKKLLAGLVCLVAVTAFAAVPVVAQAEETVVQTLLSSETNSLCVNPKAMKPTIGGKLNFAPLTKAHKGPFPDTGKACAPETPTHPVAMGGPSEKAFPYNGAITGARWVSINAKGEDSSNPPPKYYIYDATFTLCANQVATAEINVNMFADNTAGAFLDGVPIGHLGFGLPATNHENFDQEGTTPHGPIGGWPFGPNVGAAGGFKAGLNTLQFVVLDESPGNTGLDFSATVISPPCLPHWYSNGKLLNEGEPEPVTTSGTLVSKVGEIKTTCKLKDKEIIENPKGGGAGTDEMTEFVLSGCKAAPSPCPGKTKLEIEAHKLPWATHLTAAPTRDVIEGIELEVRCSGSLLATYTGTLTPTVGSSTLEFGPGSGELAGSSGVSATITGTDKLKGPAGDEKITADESAPRPKWWLEGELFKGKEPIAEETNVVAPLELELHGKKVENFTIACGKVKIKSGEIEGPSSRREEAEVYEECKVVGKEAECTIEPIVTRPLKAQLEGSTGATTLKFEPESGTELASYEVKGATCAVKGFYAASGEMICDYSGVETESAEHPLEFTETTGSKVKINGQEAAFRLTDRVHLASGKLWSAF
jgi:hypothetical protein